MVKKVKEYINRSEFVKNSLTLFTGTSIAQIIPFLISPILSRIYTPGDFGILALYMSIASVLGVISTGRYELAIMLPKKNEDAVNILILSIFLAAIVSFIVLLIVIFFNGFFSEISGNEGISFFLYFLPVSIFCIGLFKSLNYWFNRNNKFKNIAVSKVLASSGNSGVNLLVGFLEKGSFGLVFGWIFGQILSSGYLLKTFIKREKTYFKFINKKRILYLLKRYKKFPLFDTWSEMLNVLSVELPIILLIFFFGEDITGHFSFASKVILVPFSLLAFSMGQAFFKRASDLKSENQSIKVFTFNVLKKLIQISVIPLAVIGFFGDFIFPFVFGKEWMVAGNYSRIISLWIFTIFLSSPLTNLFALFERQKTNFYFNLLTFFVRISLLVLVAYFTKDDFLAVFWYALSGFLLRFAYLGVIIKIAEIKFKTIVFEISKYAIPVIAVSALIRYIILL